MKRKKAQWIQLELPPMEPLKLPEINLDLPEIKLDLDALPEINLDLAPKLEWPDINLDLDLKLEDPDK